MARNGFNLWLVAEDSDDDFFLLQRACSNFSPAPKLRRANNGVEAQDYLTGHGPFGNRAAHPLPAMVVSDLNMPLMEGLELLAWFKGQSWEPTIPFVLLTDSRDQRDMDRARERGADGYLVKPQKFEDFVKTVEEISERHCIGCRAAEQDNEP